MPSDPRPPGPTDTIRDDQPSISSVTPAVGASRSTVTCRRSARLARPPPPGRSAITAVHANHSNKSNNTTFASTMRIPATFTTTHDDALCRNTTRRRLIRNPRRPNGALARHAASAPYSSACFRFARPSFLLVTFFELPALRVFPRPAFAEPLARPLGAARVALSEPFAAAPRAGRARSFVRAAALVRSSGADAADS
jgi:hypothetical protein